MFYVGEEEINAVTDTIKRGVLTRFQGGTTGYLAQAERDLAEKIGVKHALMVNSGTSALMCALVALNIGKGDEVLVSAYTWISNPLVPMLLQAVPKLVEIDESLTMDPEDLERKITPGTKCVLITHMGNQMCDMDRIMAVADKHGIPVVEDACQAVGITYKGKRLGSFGAVGCFSFNNYKNITCGEGGAVLCNDDVRFDRTRLWHDAGTFVQAYDAPVKIDHFAGQDYRADEIKGAMIWAQLKRLDGFIANLRERRKLAADVIKSVGKYRLAPSNDPENAVALAIQFDAPEEFAEVAAKKEWKNIFDTCGRHVYTNWPPLVNRRAYRDDVNPFLTPEGENACFDKSAAPRTLDILKRSMYVYLTWDAPLADIERQFKEL